ncbi:ZN416 protein, partial [Chloropsis cyanopogon]|nr:ZN416 protein [Chloropsis cyanopogon]
HTRERPYRCGQCSSSGSSNLAKHSHVHSGERPYRCSQCGESFGFQPQLMQHQKHHAEQ